MKYIIFFLAFTVTGIVGGYGQHFSSTHKKADKFYREARSLFRAGEVEKSRNLLEKAAALDSAFSALYLLRADLFHKQGDRDGEMRSIEKALAIDSLKGYAYYYLVLADGYFDRGDYGTAEKFYRLYLERDKRLTGAAQAKKRLEDCAFALEALKSQERRAAELFLQSEHPVYWPSLDVTGNTLLYTEQAGDRESMWMLRDSVRYPLDFYPEGKCGAPSLTADGRMMYFTMVGGRGRSDIYVAYRLSDTSWTAPISLGEPVNTDGWEAQPAISADGTRLFFASTREGGRGGSDIWCSRLLRREPDGKQIWSQPKCLFFNTPGDEMAPFLYFDNQTLFFSSDGYPGMGRKDIYKADLKEVNEPQNIGITVNSQKDELGFIVDASGQWGYFSSDISGRRCIYRYRLDDTVACPPAAYLRLLTKNEAGEAVSPDYLTVVAVESGDTLAYYDRVYAHSDMLACVPAETLLLVGAVKKGYMLYSDTLAVKAAGSEHPRQKTIVLRRVEKERTLVLKGVFFDVDDYHLKPESYNELRRVVEFMRLNPEVKIEVSGHTDDSGSDEHNYRLSEDRAFEVYKYLFLHRIDKNRMSYKGYGKDRPLEANGSEAGRAANRRTEIRIK